MPQAIVRVNMNYSVSETELKESAREVIDPVLQAPGLQWKIWIIDEETKRTGGVYCFDSRVNAQAYADGPVVAKLKEAQIFANLEVEVFDVMQPHSSRTHAPL